MIYDEDPFRRRPENRWPGEIDRRGLSEWRKIWANGIPGADRLPKSCYRVAAKGIQPPWRWDCGMNSTNLDVVREMSVETIPMMVKIGHFRGRIDGNLQYGGEIW